VIGDLQPAQVSDVLAQRQLAVEMDGLASDRRIAAILLD
jgi:hypothetical protein